MPITVRENHIIRLEADVHRIGASLYRVGYRCEDAPILESNGLVPVHQEIELASYLYAMQHVAPVIEFTYRLEGYYWKFLYILNRLHIFNTPHGERYSWKHHFKPFQYLNKLKRVDRGR